MAQIQEKLEKTTRALKEKDEELCIAKRDLTKTENELATMKTELSTMKSELLKLQNERKDLENKLQAEKKDSRYWESKASEFETDLQVIF